MGVYVTTLVVTLKMCISFLLFRQATGHKDGPKTKCCGRLLAESFHYPHQATPPYLNLEQ